MSAALNIPDVPPSPYPCVSCVSCVSSVAKSHPHPQPLREQAFALHCQGLRSPAISEQLGVPQRTIRAWIAADLKTLAEEQRATRREQLALAVERQHTLTATAWSEFEAETAARHALLDALLHALTGASAPDTNTAAGNNISVPRLPASTPAPRYLSLILQADKEIARLLGLYTLAKLDILTPAPDTDTSGASIVPTSSESPAESATASTGLAAGIQPANPHSPPTPEPDTSISHMPAESAPSCATNLENPAESATIFVPSCSPSPSVPSVLNSRLSAESATESEIPAKTAMPLPSSVALCPPRSRRVEPPIPAESATTPSIASAAHAAPLSAHGEGPGVRSLRPRATRKRRTDRAPRRLRH